VVWGIASYESDDRVSQFIEQYGLSFPILMDRDGVVEQQYFQMIAFPSAAYPQDWIVGNEGRIIYQNNHFELNAMIHAIESQL
jgi:peroxiredoxin